MSLLITFLQGWTVLFVLLKLLESLTHGRLSSLLSRHNIRLHYCFVSVHTTQFNTPLEAFSRRRKSFLNYWFSLGVFFGLIGLLLSVVLLLTNVALILLDFVAPPFPPPPPHLPVNLPPHRPTPRLHSALSLASPRAPSPRIPFLHYSQRPWFLPSVFWHNLSPRDHSAAHSLAISTRMAAAPAMFKFPTRRSHPSGFFDYPPPPPPGHRHHYPRHRRHLRNMAHRGRIRGLHKPPCKRRHRAQTPWNLFRRPLPPQALPPPALPGPDQRPAIGDGRRPGALAEEDDDEEEADLVANGEKSSITISWRTRNLLSLYDADPELKKASRFPAELQNKSDSTTTGTSSSSRTQEEFVPPHRTFLTPLLPGITVPAGDIWYMIVAVLAAAVIHELGHALAAGMQNAQVSGIGGFIALLIPGAYVQLEGIEELSPFRQLKVYCAGPWHNVVSAILALIVAGWLPAIMGGLYACEQGAMVVSLPEMSPLHGHVEPGDIIVRLGKFEVRDGGPSFRMAVSQLISTEDSVGFCVREDLYRNHSKPRSLCCTREYLDNMEAGERLRHKCFRVEGIANRTSCLDLVAVSRQERCRQTSECNGRGVPGSLGRVVPRDEEREGEIESSNRAYAAVGASAGVGDDGDTEDTEAEVDAKADEGKPEGGLKRRERTSCFIPVLPMRQQLVDIEVRSGRTGEAVIFFYEGFPRALGQSVTVSSYIPRAWAYGPAAVVRAVARLDVPNAAERLLQYFASISLGLGVLNMAPVVYLDGEMSSALFVRVLAPKMGRVVGGRVRSLVVVVGTVLLVVNMVVALFEMEQYRGQELRI